MKFLWLLLGLLYMALLCAPVWAFNVDLIQPSAQPPLAPMVYGQVSGEVDSLDDTLFHLSVTLNDGLKAFLGGQDRFGLTGFWFNTTMPLVPDHITLIPPGAPWKMQINNPNCPGGCAHTGSQFGEFLHKFLWRGPINERPDRLDIDFGMGRPVLEEDFMQWSTPKAETDTPGHFTAYIDGFKLTVGTDTTSGTFVRD